MLFRVSRRHFSSSEIGVSRFNLNPEKQVEFLQSEFFAVSKCTLMDVACSTQNNPVGPDL